MTFPQARRGLRVALVGLAVGAALAALLAWVFADRLRTRLRDAAALALAARYPYARLGDRLELHWPAEAVFGPVQLALAPDGPAVVHVETVRVRLRGPRLLTGHLEPEALSFSGIRIEGGPDGRDLTALAEVTRKAASTSSHDGTLAIAFDDLLVAFDHGTRLEVGPFDGHGTLARDAAGRRVALEAHVPGGGSVSLAVPPPEGPALATLFFERASLSTLRTLRLPVKVEGGTVTGRLDLGPSGATLAVDLQELSVSGHRLATGPVGPMRLRVQGPVSWDLARRKVSTPGLDLRLGDVGDAAVTLAGEVVADAEPHFALSLTVPKVSFAALVGGLPEVLAPGEGASGVDGPLDAVVRVAGPLAEREAWDLDIKLELAALRKVARTHRSRLLEPFVHHPLLAEGRGRALEVGPANPNFVPFGKIPPSLVRAVLLSEDAGFFGHPGFDFDSLEENLFAPHAEGGVVRGGSTISQQLAKNLFLTREKTYARKIREAFVTLALEASLPKERLLEIYLNIIEWGPDIYGVGEAARHYFDKPAADLSVREAVFLATIIPNPVKYHVYCARGALTETWEEHVAFLLAKLHTTGDLDDATYEGASTAVLEFHHR